MNFEFDLKLIAAIAAGAVFLVILVVLKVKERQADLQVSPDNVGKNKFLNNVEKLFVDFQNQKSRGDLTPLRPMLSDGLFRRIQTELKIIKSVWLKHVTTDVVVKSVKILNTTTEPPYCTLDVGIEFTAKNVDVHSENPYEYAVHEALQEPTRHCRTVWSFLRKTSLDKQTEKQTQATVFEGQCPNCGAPLEVSQATRCIYCNVLVNSGSYDWVLTKISDEKYWKSQPILPVRGLKKLKSIDADFCQPLGEDIACYIFWRWMEAKIEKNFCLLSNIARPYLLKPPPPKKDTSKIVKWHGIYKVFVDSVTLTACQAECRDGYNRIHAEVNWRCAYAKWKKADNTHAIRFNLRKKTNATSKNGMSYARCPNCEAPLMENDSTICEFCDYQLMANEKHWVLESTTTLK